jgi:hypothetical protein
MSQYNDKIIKYSKQDNEYKKNKYIYKSNLHAVRRAISLIQRGGNYRSESFFNKMTWTIDWVDPTRANPAQVDSIQVAKSKYKYIDSNTLENLSMANYTALTDFITSHGMQNSILHLSNRLIENVADTSAITHSWLGNGMYFNPSGLWVSCGSAWIDFIGSGGAVNRWAMAQYVYSVRVQDTVRQIHSIDEFKQFVKEYKKPNDVIKINDTMDWDRIKEKYDGLIICPYLGDELWGGNANRMSMYGDPVSIENYFKKLLGDVEWMNNPTVLSEWYRHWETATGVIWRDHGIRDMMLVKRLDTFDHLIDDELVDVVVDKTASETSVASNKLSESTDL